MDAHVQSIPLQVPVLQYPLVAVGAPSRHLRGFKFVGNEFQVSSSRWRCSQGRPQCTHPFLCSISLRHQGFIMESFQCQLKSPLIMALRRLHEFL